jgi:hypothetical protein
MFVRVTSAKKDLLQEIITLVKKSITDVPATVSQLSRPEDRFSAAGALSPTSRRSSGYTRHQRRDAATQVAASASFLMTSTRCTAGLLLRLISLAPDAHHESIISAVISMWHCIPRCLPNEKRLIDAY